MTSRFDASNSSQSADDEVMNLAEARNRLSGDEELLEDLAQMFFEDADELLSKIRDGASDLDLMPEVRRAAHSLKGLSSNFGARRTMKCAFAVECSAEQQDVAALPPLIVALERETERLSSALRDSFRRS